MKLIKQSYEILTPVDRESILKNIEKYARVCHKSEEKIDDSVESASAFVTKVLSWGHSSILEHEKITIRFITDRGLSHELVRHRLASYLQQSTRYCDSTNMEVIIPSWLPQDIPETDIEKLKADLDPSVTSEIGANQFSNISSSDLAVIVWLCIATKANPSSLMVEFDGAIKNTDLTGVIWLESMLNAEKAYRNLIEKGWSKDQARSVLPNSLKTEIIMTCNLRELQHILKLRTSPHAHEQFRALLAPLQKELHEKLPEIF